MRLVLRNGFARCWRQVSNVHAYFANDAGFNAMHQLLRFGIVNLTTARMMWYHRSHDNNCILAHV